MATLVPRTKTNIKSGAEALTGNRIVDRQKPITEKVLPEAPSTTVAKTRSKCYKHYGL